MRAYNYNCKYCDNKKAYKKTGLTAMDIDPEKKYDNDFIIWNVRYFHRCMRRHP